MFSAIYTTLFFKPILNFVVFVYNSLPAPLMNMAMAIVVVIIFIRLILIPLTLKETRTRKVMKHLQDSGELKELEEHKKDPQVYMAKMKALYAKYDLKPLSGTFLSLLVQLPIFFALYRVFRMIIAAEDFSPFLYSFNQAPESFNIMVWNFIDLSIPNIGLAIILGVAQYAFMNFGPLASATGNTKALEKTTDDKASQAQAMAGMGKFFKTILPVFMVFIGLSLPAGITLYIILSVLINWVLLIFIDRAVDKKLKAKYDI